MKNVSIKYRIFAISWLAVLGMLGIAAMLVYEKVRYASGMEHLESLASLAPKISNLVHEMQFERGLSAGFIVSKGKSFAEALPQQRGKTDERLGILSEALQDFDIQSYGEEFAKRVETARQNLAQLAEKRQAVSDINSTVADMAAYYTGTIDRLFHVIEDIALESTDSDVTKAITAYDAFIVGKEHAGLERALGSAGFSAGTFAPDVYRRFVQEISAQNTYFKLFTQYATPARNDFYASTVTGPAVDEVSRMREITIESTTSWDTKGVDGPEWFAQITEKIDLLKTVEDRLAQDLIALTVSRKATAERAFITVAAATAVLFLITGAFAFVIIRGITKPMEAMTGVMGRLAEGDNTVDVPTRDNKDEIGAMAQAVQVFKDNAIRMEEMRAEQEAAEKRAEEEKRRMMRKLADEFEASVKGVVEAVSSASTEMQSSAQSLSATAEQSTQQATAVASASEEASSNVQTVASAAEELSSSIAEISRQVVDSARIAGEASSEAERTNATILGLNDAAQKISDVVELINDIASQTNLLALNATIEAARAGEAGKGFAVVASEVKNLATQTAKATDEIAAQVTSMQEETTQAVGAIKGITETIGKVNEIATSISSAVEEQGAATGEISRNVTEAARGTQEVSSNITGVTQASHETGSAAGQVLSSASELSKQSEILRGQVDRVLEQIRAA